MDRLVGTPAYLVVATALLAVGLFGSTYEISLTELRRNARSLLVAVTAGVLMKAAVISGIMVVVFRDPSYLVLGVVVAQIDPLSIAATRYRSRMSDRAGSMLAAWAAFDDPVTVLLAFYLSALTARAAVPGRGLAADVTGVAVNVLTSLLLVGLAFLCWRLVRHLSRDHRRSRRAVPLAVLLLVGVLVVWRSLLLGIAATGLFFRPPVARTVRVAVDAAYLIAAFALGLLLVGGIDLLSGLVLGSAAFLAQAVVGGGIIARGLPRVDRAYLSIAQQNGITAIILALLLEPDRPGTVGIVAPAILTVNVLHLVANSVLDRRLSGRPEPLPTSRPMPDAGPYGDSEAVVARPA